MIEKLVGWAIDHKAVAIAVFALLCIAGVIAWNSLSIDAYPDISDTTVQVVTQVPGLATEEIEQQISIPVERALGGIPNLTTMRSKNSFGISTVILVFDDGVDDYWARQRVNERLVGIDLPYGAVPELNPLTAPTGEIFRYIVESSDGSHDLRSLTDIHKWTIIPYLRQISGVADVSNFGGITTQYQIELSPDRLTEYGISLSDITEKIEQNNLNAGGSILTEGSLSYVVRGIGLISDLDGLGDIVVKSVNGTPVYLKELGELKYGNLERKGVLGFSDDQHNSDDAVEGIVQMLRGENPSEVLDRVHASVDELNNEILPPGVKIHPFLDRTDLVGETLKTVSHTLLIGMLLVIVILMIFLGNLRGSLVVAVTIPIALLVAFVLMKLTGIPANLLSLGAIDFGILVDGAIVMMENILKKRERHPELELTSNDVKQRAGEVARSIFFSTIIIITAYLPLFAFEHVERKLFTPMAYTVGYALVGALLTSLLLTPGLSYMAYRKPRKLYHNRWLERLMDSYHRHIVEEWSVIAANKRIQAMAGQVLLELQNEPVNILTKDGARSDAALPAYCQKMVDMVRKKGFKGVVLVPGTGYQSNFRDFVAHPIKDPLNNYGYAVHVYPGWYAQHDGNADPDRFLRHFLDSVPVVRDYPCVVTECDWSPERPGQGKLNEFGQEVKANYGTWGTASTSKWGGAYLKTIERLGNVSTICGDINLLFKIDDWLKDGRIVVPFECSPKAFFDLYAKWGRQKPAPPAVRDRRLPKPLEGEEVPLRHARHLTTRFFRLATGSEELHLPAAGASLDFTYGEKRPVGAETEFAALFKAVPHTIDGKECVQLRCYDRTGVLRTSWLEGGNGDTLSAHPGGGLIVGVCRANGPHRYGQDADGDGLWEVAEVVGGFTFRNRATGRYLGGPSARQSDHPVTWTCVTRAVRPK